MEEKDSECVGQRLEAGETVRLACTTDLFSWGLNAKVMHCGLLSVVESILQI